MKPRALLLAALLLALVGGAAAQGARPAAPRAETPQALCAAANRQAVADLGQAFEATRNRNRLNAVLMSRLLAFEAQLATLRAALPRDGRKLGDCEQLSQAIAAEHERLQRLAGPDPQVAECGAANQAAHAQALALLAALPDAANPAAQAVHARLQSLAPALAQEGQTLVDCRQAAEELARELAQAQGLAGAAASVAAEGAALQACRSANARAHAEALQAWRDWAARQGVSSSVPEHDAARQRLGWLHDDLARPGATLGDCRKLGEALAQERARVPSAAQAALAADPLASKSELPVEAVMAAPVLIRLRPQAAPVAPAAAAVPAVPASAPGVAAAAVAPAAAPPPAQNCREPHAQRYNTLVQRFSSALQTKPLPEPQRQHLQALGQRLDALYSALSGPEARLDCAALAQALERIDADLRALPQAGAGLSNKS